MNDAWYKVVYLRSNPETQIPSPLIATAKGEYDRQENKKDFCVFIAQNPLTVYFSPRAAELCDDTLRLLAEPNHTDIEVSACDVPTAEPSLKLMVGDCNDCHGLLNLRND